MNATVTLRERIRVREDLPPAPVRRALRELRGLTQADIAEAVSEESGFALTAAAVGHWERGVRNPGRQHLAAYVAVLRFLRDGVDPK